jgi:hypothetical protein
MDCRGQSKKVKKAEREDTDYKEVHVKLRKSREKIIRGKKNWERIEHCGKYRKGMKNEKEQGRIGHSSKDQERTEKIRRTGKDRKVIQKRKPL